MHSKAFADRQIGLDAARWLMRLQDDTFDPRDEQAGARARDEAFLQWLAISPRHVRVFLETFQTSRQLDGLDSQRSLQIQEWLRDLSAEVVSLRDPTVADPIADTVRRRRAGWRMRPGRPLVAGFSAVVVLAVAVGAWLMVRPAAANYATSTGEQRTCKLADGSFIYLNTDSRVDILFSETERRVKLVAGEALFVVERDSRRPFVVNAGAADIQVLGTQFNVRRRAELTDVAVVEGRVRVMPSDAAIPLLAAENSGSRSGADARVRGADDRSLQLTAGQQARVSNNQVARRDGAGIDSALAWRARRLVFTESPLEEVVSEFNRYNRRRMRVEGEVARTRKLTGIFDADRPNALILYAMKDEGLVVEPDGEDWVIRGR